MKASTGIFILIAAVAGIAQAAQPTTAPSQPTQAMLVQRANADAVSKLYAQIASETIADVPVAQLIDRVDGHAIMMNGLSKAEQVGGPRVVGEEFVQVQLQISGTRAASLVLQAVAVKPEKSPITPDRLAYFLKDWNQRIFTTTGASITVASEVMALDAQAATRISTTANAVTTPLPTIEFDVMPAWVNNPIGTSASATREQSALRTARAAERSAREALRKKIESLVVHDDVKLGDVATGDESIRMVVDAAVDAATIAGIDYNADGSVDVRISLDGQQLWQALLATR